MNRRGFLASMLAAAVAPAILKFPIMPIRGTEKWLAATTGEFIQTRGWVPLPISYDAIVTDHDYIDTTWIGCEYKRQATGLYSQYIKNLVVELPNKPVRGLRINGEPSRYIFDSMELNEGPKLYTQKFDIYNGKVPTFEVELV